MQAKAIQRYVRITPRKCNQVLDLIRGDSVEEAQTTLQFTPKLKPREKLNGPKLSLSIKN